VKEDIKELFRLADFRESIYSSVEYSRIQELRLFQSAYEVFEGNYKELQKRLLHHRKIDLHELLQSKNGSKKLKKIHLEITRCLHNFLASSFSLIDNTRENVSNSNTDFRSEYKDKINSIFSDSPISTFIKDLRRFTQHYKMPPVSTRTTIRRVEPDQLERETFLLITTSHLLNFGWSATSRKMIEQNPKGIEINRIISDYYILVRDFHKWYKKSQKSLLKNDLKYISTQEKILNSQAAVFNLSRFIDQGKTSFEELKKVLFRHISTYFINKITNCTREERIDLITKSLKRINVVEPNIIQYIKEINPYWP
jgi:hypothetical protein